VNSSKAGLCASALAILNLRVPRTRNYLTRFQVLTAVGLQMIAFWDIVECCLVDVDRRFRGDYCLHNQGDIAVMMQEVSILPLKHS
jgi:hypothetical protein